jgi:hypothetical protein
MPKKARLAAIISIAALAAALFGCSADGAAAKAARSSLASEAPSSDLVKAALSDFSYDGADCSATEAKAMLAWINAGLYASDGACATGRLGSGYYLTIWCNTYGYTGVYGLRYGRYFSSYWSSNSSYFEIAKW